MYIVHTFPKYIVWLSSVCCLNRTGSWTVFTANDICCFIPFCACTVFFSPLLILWLSQILIIMQNPWSLQICLQPHPPSSMCCKENTAISTVYFLHHFLPPECVFQAGTAQKCGRVLPQSAVAMHVWKDHCRQCLNLIPERFFKHLI